MTQWNHAPSGFAASGQDAVGSLSGSSDLGTAVDAVEAYFECISTCSLDDAECITVCTEVLRDNS